MFVYNNGHPVLFETQNDFANVIYICSFYKSKICKLFGKRKKQVKRDWTSTNYDN